MTDLGEKIAIKIVRETALDCPFDHKDGPYNRTNDFSNDSGALGGTLASQGDIQISVKLGGRAKSMPLGFQAHHLIPGTSIKGASPLLEWMTNGKMVKGDVGYQQNDAWNGLWLPALHRFTGWGALSKGGGYEVQFAYAYAAMESTSWKQFHMGDGSHGDYNAWVRRTLEKYRVKMLELKVECKPCEDCGNTKKLFRPPYRINDWVCALAERLKGKLQGSPGSWRPPLCTSDFAVMVGLGYTPDKVAGIT